MPGLEPGISPGWVTGGAAGSVFKDLAEGFAGGAGVFAGEMVEACPPGFQLGGIGGEDVLVLGFGFVQVAEGARVVAVAHAEGEVLRGGGGLPAIVFDGIQGVHGGPSWRANVITCTGPASCRPPPRALASVENVSRVKVCGARVYSSHWLHLGQTIPCGMSLRAARVGLVCCAFCLRPAGGHRCGGFTRRNRTASGAMEVGGGGFLGCGRVDVHLWVNYILYQPVWHHFYRVLRGEHGDEKVARAMRPYRIR